MVKKSNFISCDSGILLVCLEYRSKVMENQKRICVAICFRSSNHFTGLFTPFIQVLMMIIFFYHEGLMED